ncbi:MAG: glycosyltransferase family 4 protein [Planctomycetota bacterium]|nr:glycosyltransferase family 4 protein [Planctomycetota bacterium]
MDILQINSARKFVGEAGHTLDLARALAARGHRVTLCLREGYETIARAREAGLDPVGLRMNSRWWPPDDWADIRLLRSLIRDRDIRIIHAHRGKDHWLAVLAARAFSGVIRVVRTRHVVMPPTVNFANRWLARKTERMICVSRAVLLRCEECGMYAREKLRLIPGGVDIARFRPRGQREAVRRKLGLPPDAPVAAHVARFAVVKDHRTLLAAWRETVAALPAAKLLLVGDGRMRAEIERQASDAGLADTVVFLGARRDVPEILEAADVGVLSSSGSEGFSRAVAEYMAMGLPVAATGVGAVPDLVEDGREGLIVPPRDPAALAAALRRLLSDTATARRMGEAAMRRARAEFDWEKVAGRVEDLYREVLDGEASA